MREPKCPVKDDNITVIPRRRRLSRAVLAMLFLAIIVMALVFVASWHLMIPNSSVLMSGENPKAVPGSLSKADVRDISKLCRRHTAWFVFDQLGKGEFWWFRRSSRVLFKQKIDRLADNRDGTHRVNIVVYDRKDPDGFIP